MSREITIQTTDGAMDAHVFVPDAAAGPLPTVADNG